MDTANGVPSVGHRARRPDGGPERGLGCAAAARLSWCSATRWSQGDGDHTAMAVAPDSLALNGGTIRSVATGADAAIGHAGALVRGAAGRTPARSKARALRALPEQPRRGDGVHGRAAFQCRARGAELTGRSPDGLLEVEGGTVTRAARSDARQQPGLARDGGAVRRG